MVKFQIMLAFFFMCSVLPSAAYRRVINGNAVLRDVQDHQTHITNQTSEGTQDGDCCCFTTWQTQAGNCRIPDGHGKMGKMKHEYYYWCGSKLLLTCGITQVNVPLAKAPGRDCSGYNDQASGMSICE